VKAVQTHEDSHPTIASLYRPTYGILFFATPHKGLVVADMRRMLDGDPNHPRHTLLEEINKESDVLRYQLADFKNLIRDRRIVSFFETEQTRELEWVRKSHYYATVSTGWPGLLYQSFTNERWERSGTFVTALGSDSALLQLPDEIEDKVPLHADHSQIVKFDSRNAQGYQSVLQKLRDFQELAQRVVAGRFRT
jgi:hypothetical protein